MGKLEGKVALITGGGQTVGLSIARVFATEGANLVITGRDEQKLRSVVPQLEDLGAKVVVSPGDAAVRANAEKAVQAAVDAFGRLDVLVNNAQAMSGGVPLEEVDEALVNLTIGSGFYGTLWHMIAALPHLKQTKGAIINFGTKEGIAPVGGWNVYGAGKEAIRGLTRTAAKEWGKYGVRINVVNPAAWVPTTEAYFAAFPERKEAYYATMSIPRFGDAEADIAPVVVFLASEASQYVTGQTINVDGGQVML
jgi:NAD(P)-dependent dehydrogenase (short-subunit alcohol dehydrogenase family)